MTVCCQKGRIEWLLITSGPGAPKRNWSHSSGNGPLGTRAADSYRAWPPSCMHFGGFLDLSLSLPHTQAPHDDCHFQNDRGNSAHAPSLFVGPVASPSPFIEPTVASAPLRVPPDPIAVQEIDPPSECRHQLFPRTAISAHLVGQVSHGFSAPASHDHALAQGARHTKHAPIILHIQETSSSLNCRRIRRLGGKSTYSPGFQERQPRQQAMSPSHRH